MQKKFVTSDWHIGHKNIIQFSNRPFKDLGDMYDALIKRYNSVVGEYDICYFLGDMVFTTWQEGKGVIGQLNGTKIAIMGNHDKSEGALYNSGFDLVLNAATVFVGKQRVTMSHAPLPGLYREDTTGFRNENENWHGETRAKMKRFMTFDNGQFHLHGHIHSPNGDRSERILGRQFDVGVDANKYTPVSFSQIESWVIKNWRKYNDQKKI